MVWMSSCCGCDAPAPWAQLTVVVWDEVRAREYRYHPEHPTCLEKARELGELLRES